ncbi:YceD family protein [uncultured Thiodictyon sp.]|uniref:YceD family protein n=1 Tax=uncultured Thiodictyon sp. TaxID=1846217 RepID=UPI0025E8E886|nr:YceD family protein [uncultured Thiodictyon sp.]
MFAPLPQELDLWRAVRLGAAFAGSATLAQLPRLAAAVVGADGSAHYTLAFERDEARQAVAMGRVAMDLRLRCERCMGEVGLSLDLPIALALVRAVSQTDTLGLDRLPEVADQYDPLPVGEAPINPLDLIEDELLLALPLAPIHEVGECQAALPPDSTDSAQAGAVDEKKNPFAVLAALKSKG